MVAWLQELQSHLPGDRGMKRRFCQTRGRRQVSQAQIARGQEAAQSQPGCSFYLHHTRQNFPSTSLTVVGLRWD